jgi:hypothetical protein
MQKVTFTKIRGKKEKGRPAIRRVGSVEQDLKVLAIQGWRNKAEERSQ